MPRFIFNYRSPKDPERIADADTLSAWMTFLNETIAPNAVDPGWPVFEPSLGIGTTGPSTQPGGYSVVTADDLEAALSMAERCPAIGSGGGVEVSVLAEVPAEHPAEQIRRQLA